MIKYLKIKKKILLEIISLYWKQSFLLYQKILCDLCKSYAEINVKFLNRYDQSNLIQIRKFKK